MDEIAGETKGAVPKIVEKPISVMVFGVLNIIFACLGLFFSSMMIRQLATAVRLPGVESRYRLFLMTMNSIGFGFSIWLLALGIGFLKLRKWARNGSVIYECLVILFFIADTGINLLALSFGWIEVPQEEMDDFVIDICLSIGGGLIYPVLLLCFMKTKKVKRAFAAIGG